MSILDLSDQVKRIIIVGLLFWILQQIPLPEPFGRIVRVVLIVSVAWLGIAGVVAVIAARV